MSQKKRAVLLLIGCCLIYGVSCGISVNCRGVFYRPMAAGLGVSLSQLNLAGLFNGIISAITIPICCKLYHKLPCRPFLPILALIYSISIILMGTAQSLWFVYLLNGVLSITGGFLNTYPVQMMISAWYPNKKGTVLGFVSMSTGIVGTVMNPVIAQWIQAYGWRNAYYISGGIVFFSVMTATLFLLHREPAEVGCEPILGGKAKPSAVVAPERTSRLEIILVFAFVVTVALLNTLPQQLANFAVVSGRTAAFGATLVSCAMIGNILGKASMGVMNDRIGARFTSVLGMLLVAAACVLILNASSLWVMYLCAVGIGLLMALDSLQLPMVSRSIFTEEMYEKLYPRVCSVNVLACIASTSILSILADMDGNYTMVMGFSAVTAVLGCVVIVALGFARRTQSGGKGA